MSVFWPISIYTRVVLAGCIKVDLISRKRFLSLNPEDISSDNNLPKEMVTLANEIIAGMPERIKSCLPPDVPPGGDISGLLTAAETTVNSCRDRSSSYSSFSSSCSSCHTPPGVSAGVVAADDSGISTPPEGLSFDEYRYVAFHISVLFSSYAV